MYHIANDKRAMRSAEALYNGLLSCLDKKSYIDVTVKDICLTSGISRATFYRLFDNMTDVLFWKCEIILLQALEQGRDISHQQLGIIIQNFIETWAKNYKLLETLIRCNQTSILYELHAIHIAEFNNLFLTDTTISEVQADYLAALLSSMLPAMFQTWYQHPEEDTDMILIRFRESLRLLNGLFN